MHDLRDFVFLQISCSYSKLKTIDFNSNSHKKKSDFGFDFFIKRIVFGTKIKFICFKNIYKLTSEFALLDS